MQAPVRAPFPLGLVGRASWSVRRKAISSLGGSHHFALHFIFKRGMEFARRDPIFSKCPTHHVYLPNHAGHYDVSGPNPPKDERSLCL